VLPTNYVIQKFYQLTNSPKHNKASNTYYAGCPICREGKSWGKKRRLYYVVDDNLLYCQNCQRGWEPLNWLVEVTGEPRDEILKDVENYEPNIRSILEEHEKKLKCEKVKQQTLPEDSINLLDPIQVDYYADNKVCKEALKFIKQRRLDTAKYKPKTLWLSLKDYSHKNRLTIPFYDLSGQIIFYQTRALFEEDNPPKYKSKVGADKSLFNVEKIDPGHDRIYKIEGPIDTSFVRNGVGMCGLTMTELQRKQLHNYPFHEQVWVLDNDLKTDEVYEKYEKLLKNGERVFIWPKEFKPFKDVNEVCQRYNLDEFPHQLIDKNVYEGRAGLLRLASLRM
jgi:hypothetical protein